MDMSGTSMAAPNVAGVAALILEKNPVFTAQKLRDALTGTARDVGELGWDMYYGHGIVNAYAATLGVDKLHSVIFDFSDSFRVPVTVRVVPGDKLFEPYDPAKSGYAFVGWFLTGTDTEFNFNTPVNGNISLYAKWTPAESGMYAAEFPDAGFRREILRLLNMRYGVNRNDSSYVAVDSIRLSSLELLDVSGMRISDMTGLQHLSGLIGLYCTNNELTTLDVTQNKLLLELFCAYNKLTALNVTQNELLEMLYCNDNELTSLDVSKNTALTFLDCGENALSELDVSKNIKLRILLCEANFLTTLRIQHNTLLDSLICSSNLLTELDVSKNKNLEFLYCPYNLGALPMYQGKRNG